MSRDRFRYGNYDIGYTEDEPTMRHRVRTPELPNAPDEPDRSGSGTISSIRRAARETVDIPLVGSYSPLAIGLNAVPFSDEILGLLTDVTSDADYDEAQRAWEQARYEASEQNPGSAITGAIGQAAITAPLALAGPAVGATRAARTASAVLPAVGVGAGLGAIGGAATSAARGEDASVQERVNAAREGAARGALTGAAVGGVAGGLGAAGRAMAGTRSAILGVPARIGGAALQGAGWGVASTPDLSGAPVTDLPGLAVEAPSNAATGAAFGAGAGAIGEAVGAVPRAREYVRHLFSRLPAEEGASRAPIVADADIVPDEALGEIQALPGLDMVQPSMPTQTTQGMTSLGRSVEAGREAGTISTGDVIEDFVRTGLRRDPAIARLQSLGMSDAEIRRASARFGGDPRRLVAAAREFGLLPNRPYDPAAEMSAVEGLQRASGANVRRFREMLGSLEGEISGASIADDIQQQAESLAASTSPASQRRARMLNEIAQDFRYGVGNRPTVDPTTGETIMPSERTMSPRDLLGELDRYSEDLQRAYASATPSQDAEALMDVRRSLANVRDRFAEQEMSDLPGIEPGSNAADDYRRANRAFQLSSALMGGNNGIPGADRRQYGMFRATLGSMAGGALGDGPLGTAAGRVLGFLGENTMARYLPSLIATANEGGFAAGGPAWPGATEGIRRAVSSTGSPVVDRLTAGTERILQTDPSVFGRFEGMLRGAVNRGTLASTVTYLASTNPEFAALVERFTPQQIREIEAEQTQQQAVDPLVYGESPDAQSEDIVDVDENDELIYGTAR